MSLEQVEPIEKSQKQIIEDRIYIGNVDFKANEDDLKNFFENLSVDQVSIPSKTKNFGNKTITKHLGFAFVQFKQKEDADKAIELYNGKEFKNRKIYVKKAVAELTEEEKHQKNQLFKAKKEQAEKAKAEQVEKLKKKKKAKRIEKAKAKKALKAAAATDGDAETAPVATATEPTEPNDSGATKTPSGKASIDTIFITNLDYKANYKLLTNLFKDLKPKWIHLPIRRVPRHVYARQKSLGRSIFNKGIAFVKFSDEETQKKAIAEFNGKEINGRQIIVEAAVDARIPENAEEEADAAKTAETVEEATSVTAAK